MTEQTKDTTIDFRVTTTEKKEIIEIAKREGFDTISSFLLWLFRRFKVGSTK